VEQISTCSARHVELAATAAVARRLVDQASLGRAMQALA